MSVWLKEFSLEILHTNKVCLFMPLTSKSVDVHWECF